MPENGPVQVLDQGSLDEIMIGWKFADVYMADLPLKDMPWDHALRLVIRRDFPTLLKELLRLRPDLA
jgi:hypothetical protein